MGDGSEVGTAGTGAGRAPGAAEADAYRGLFHHNPQPMWVYALDTLAFLDVNRAAVEQYGYTRDEFLAMTIADIRPPEDVASLRDNVAQVTEGLDRAGVWRHRRKDGTVFAVEITSHTLEFEGRRAELVVAQDVQDQWEALRSLQESEAKYRLLVENQTDLVVKVDLEGRFRFVSPSYCDMFGKSEGELLGRTFMPLVHEDDQAATAKAMEALFREPFSCHLEQRAMTRHGWRWLAWADTAVRGADGEVVEIIGVGRDITDHKAVEEELRASEARYRSVVEDQTEFIVRCTPDGVRTFANGAYCRYFGLSPEAAVGASFFDLVPEAEHPALRGKIAALRPDRPVQTDEHRAIRPDGTLAWQQWTDRGVFDAEGRLVELQSVGRDIDESRRAEEALRASERRFRRLVERISDALFVHDPTGRFVDVNRAACESLGYSREELLGLSVQEIDASFDGGRDLSALLGDLAPEQVRTLEGEHRRRDGTTFPVEVKVSSFGAGEQVLYLATIRDVTERRQAEEERRRLEAKVQHAQKLESLGVLAGGIAHDFNNLLMGILGNADLALLELSAESPGREFVKRIELASQRAAELTNQMLAYSGKGRFLVEPIQLNRMLEEMDPLLRTVISKKAGLRYDLAAEVPAIEADVSQLRQVVMNLTTNASDALGDPGGSILISSGVVHADAAYLSGVYPDETLPAGEYAYLEVSDTGCGMDPATRERIFDPFYTTKFAGRGLGLAAVLGIVRGHRGAIRVYSEKGRGTTFKVLFPSTESEPSQAPQPGAAVQVPAGGGTVLVVDDDPSVRQVASQMLEMAGYEVLLAGDGGEAVACFAARPESIDLVLLDMTMPNMDGSETFQELRKLRPDVRVILSSGYNEQDATNRFAGKGLAGFIQKPYRAAKLLAAVGEALGGQRAGRSGTGPEREQEER